MSHQPERKEKNCLNCGGTVLGRFCHTCGQENIVTHQNFWSMTRHFVYDLFHFDGKFFDTFKRLFTRPGRVALEYTAGKRLRYLDPIRMYLFTSALFFIFFFAIADPKNIVDIGDSRFLSRQERIDESARLLDSLQRHPDDSLLVNKMQVLLDSSKRIELLKPDSMAMADSTDLIRLPDGIYKMHPRETVLFDTIAQEGSWIVKAFEEKWRKNKGQHDNPNEMLEVMGNSFLHNLPYLLFLSLPLFALILKLVYIRRHQFYYSDHGVFTLYHYILSFLLLLAFFGFGALGKKIGWNLFQWIANLAIFSWPVYLVLSLKYFYRQGWGKTILKFLVINFLGLLVIILLFLGFTILSIIQL